MANVKSNQSTFYTKRITNKDVYEKLITVEKLVMGNNETLDNVDSRLDTLEKWSPYHIVTRHPFKSIACAIIFTLYFVVQFGYTFAVKVWHLMVKFGTYFTFK